MSPATPDTQRNILDTLREHGAAAREHEREIEAKTDAFLAATERLIAALRDLKHTAIWIAAGLVVAAYVIVKVL